MGDIQFKVTKAMDADEFFNDHVHGSGWAGWGGWWREHSRQTSILKTAEVVIAGLDPETDEWRDYQFLREQIIDATNKAAAEYPLVAQSLIDEDFDAIAMDIVMQYAAFGKVVYG